MESNNQFYNMGLVVSPEAVKSSGYANPISNTFLLRMRGASMAPKYTGGEILACKKLDLDKIPFLQWGKIHAICSKSQGLIVRRIYPSDNPDCIKCVSDNEQYAPFDIPKNDIADIAMVVGSISME